MRLLLALVFALTVLTLGLPVALGAVAGLAVGFHAGRARQRTAHAFAVWKGHPR